MPAGGSPLNSGPVWRQSLPESQRHAAWSAELSKAQPQLRLTLNSTYYCERRSRDLGHSHLVTSSRSWLASLHIHNIIHIAVTTTHEIAYTLGYMGDQMARDTCQSEETCSQRENDEVVSGHVTATIHRVLQPPYGPGLVRPGTWVIYHKR